MKNLLFVLASVSLSAFTAVAAAQSPAGESVNVSGTWLFEVETSVGSGSPTFTFKQDGERLSGQYKGAFGEAPVTGTVKGKEIKFSFTVNAQGSDVAMTYTGSVEADAMKGKLEAGSVASGTWTAKKQADKK